MNPAVYIPPSSFWSYGTSDPSGGSNGDFYFKTDGTNVLSVWKKNAGTWASVAAFGTGSGGGGSTSAISVSGTQDGSNKVFTLSSAVTAGVGLVFVNGQLLIPGSSNDYVISGTTLTFQAACPAPLSTDVVQVFGYTDTATVVTGTSEVAVTGTQNSSNKTFTISNAINGVALVFLNGQLLTSGSSNDYTVSGTTLTFTTGRPAPLSTDVIRVMGYVSGATVVPNGGAAGQALVKNSSADGDLVWASRNSYLGTNSIGGSTVALTSGVYYCKKITTGANGGVIVAIDGYVDQTANDGDKWYAGLWTDNAGAVGRLVAVCPYTANLYLGGSAGAAGTYPARWLSFPVTSLLAGSTSYWIGIGQVGSASGARLYYAASGSDRTVTNTAIGYLTDGDRWPQVATTNNFSIRALLL